MRHVITGGSGFTGAALTYQLLERGEEVVNFDLKSPADPVLASSTRSYAEMSGNTTISPNSNLVATTSCIIWLRASSPMPFPGAGGMHGFLKPTSKELRMSWTPCVPAVPAIWSISRLT